MALGATGGRLSWRRRGTMPHDTCTYIIMIVVVVVAVVVSNLPSCEMWGLQLCSDNSQGKEGKGRGRGRGGTTKEESISLASQALPCPAPPATRQGSIGENRPAKLVGD